MMRHTLARDTPYFLETIVKLMPKRSLREVLQ
jgi:hypothetical protein